MGQRHVARGANMDLVHQRKPSAGFCARHGDVRARSRVRPAEEAQEL